MKWLLLSIALAACGFPRPADVRDSVSVGGILHGMWTGAGGVSLRLTADDVDLTYQVSENGSFTFPATVTEGSSYIVVIVAHPSMHTCTITTGATGIATDGAISVDVACKGPAVSIALSAPGPWTFDPTLEVQPTLEASVLLQDVTLTVNHSDGLVTSVQIAGVPAMLGKPSAPHQLPLGVTSIEVDLVAAGGLAMKYRVAIERGQREIEQAVYGKASNTGREDSFGQSVALSGDTLAVGAPGEDSSTTGVNGNQSDNSAPDSGAVYVFRRNGSMWTQQAYIKASNTQAGDGFGTSVALSGDTLAVSAFRAAGVGAVYIFQRIDSTWVQQAILLGVNVEPEDNFGQVIALSGDTLVVGAPAEDSSATGVNGDSANNGKAEAGAAYVFKRSGPFWTQQAYIKASNTDQGDRFGFSVAVSGDTLAVAAQGEGSCSRGVNGEQLNNSCIITGAVYVFQRTNNTWAQQAYVKASNTTNLAQFGYSIALVGDIMAVGAASEGSSATGVNGNQMDNSAFGSGAVYVFQRSGATWTQEAYVKASNTEVLDAFGASVALSGEMMVVGAFEEDSVATGVNGNQDDNSAMRAGAAYVFRRTGTTWVQEAYVKSSNTEIDDRWCSSLALSGDTLVIAAAHEDGGETGINRNQADNRAEAAGAIYVFR